MDSSDESTRPSGPSSRRIARDVAQLRDELQALRGQLIVVQCEVSELALTQTVRWRQQRRIQRIADVVFFILVAVALCWR